MYNIVKMTFGTFLLEALVVGVALVVVATPVSWLASLIRTGAVELFPDHFGLMVLTLFVSGALTHGVFEVAGLNDYYVQYKCKCGA